MAPSRSDGRFPGAFPERPARERLAATVLAELHDDWRVFDRRHRFEASMAGSPWSIGPCREGLARLRRR